MTIDKYRMIMPHTVFSGKDALENLADITAVAKKIAVFTDPGVLAVGLTDRVEEILRDCGRETVIISDLPAEPDYGQVQKVVEDYKKSGADMIVAVGGGSVMDSAKLASVLATDAYGVKELLDRPGLGKKTVATCMIPTTAGTGAEATINAIVAVPEKNLKVGIVNRDMMPDYVILDAEMIKNLPRRIAAATGIDAMAHAIECFTSKRSNPFSDTFALEAFDLIMNHIERACKVPEDLEAKNAMQIAACYAGIAITSSGTTAVHALSYPLGGKYHIAHGISNAILLVPVMKFNEPAVRERLARAYDRVVHGEKSCVTEEQKSAYVINRMDEIVKRLDIPTNLAEFGVSMDDLDSLVESGMQVTRLLRNNMRELGAEDARQIYSEVLKR